MNNTQMFETAQRMIKYGGSFVSSLGQAMIYADPTNTKRIMNAFPEYIQEYGPEGRFANDVNENESF